MPRKKKIENSMTKESLIKLKKKALIDMAEKENIVLPEKHTKLIIVNLLLEKLEKSQKSQKSQKDAQVTKASTKASTKISPNTPAKSNNKIPKKKKRGRRAKNELKIESIINERTINTKLTQEEPNIIVHLSGITLDSIKTQKKNPLRYNPTINIPKESSAIKENNFAWINNTKKQPVTSFSFLTKTQKII